ncbi:hypothetical protein [Helicobacter sp. 23-1045]
MTERNADSANHTQIAESNPRFAKSRNDEVVADSAILVHFVIINEQILRNNCIVLDSANCV